MTVGKTNRLMTAFPHPELGTAGARFLHDISQSLKVSGHKLQPFIRFQEDLFLDRLDVELLLAGLERRHARFLTHEEANSIETIGDLQRAFLPQAA